MKVPIDRALQLLAGVLVLLLHFPSGAGSAAPEDGRDVGPKVGEKAPAFSAVDQTGATRTLESLMGPEGLMLVFFRSADW